jgi:hypothetical protein
MAQIDIWGCISEQTVPLQQSRISRYQRYKKSTHYGKSKTKERCKLCRFKKSFEHHDYLYHKCANIGYSWSAATDIRLSYICDRFELEPSLKINDMRKFHFLHVGPKSKNGFWKLLEILPKDIDRMPISEKYELYMAVALKQAVAYCKSIASKTNPVSLVIHGIKGQFQQERTYPRSADPKKSKG